MNPKKKNDYFGLIAAIRPALEKELAGQVGPHNPVSLDELECLARIADRPDYVLRADQITFFRFLAASPDFALRLLQFMRKEFAKLKSSQAGQVRRFLRTASVVPVKRGGSEAAKPQTTGKVYPEISFATLKRLALERSKLNPPPAKHAGSEPVQAMSDMGIAKALWGSSPTMRILKSRTETVKEQRKQMRRLDKRTAAERKPGAKEYLRTGKGTDRNEPAPKKSKKPAKR